MNSSIRFLLLMLCGESLESACWTRADRPHQAERAGRHRPRAAGADRAPHAVPDRAHHLGRELRLRTAPHRHPDLTDTLAFDRGAFKQGCWRRGRATRLVRPRAAPPAVRSRHRPARAVPHRADVPGDAVRRAASGSRTPAKGAATPTRTSSTSRTPTASTPSIATGASPRRSARATCRSGSTSRSTPAEVDAVRDELAALPRPWIAVAVGAKWVTKRWPPAHFAELLNRACSRTSAARRCSSARPMTPRCHSEVIAQLQRPALATSPARPRSRGSRRCCRSAT